MNENGTEKNPLLGLALIMYSMDAEKVSSRAEAFRFVLEGSCTRLGYTIEDVRAWLGENLEMVKTAYRERRPAG